MSQNRLAPSNGLDNRPIFEVEADRDALSLLYMVPTVMTVIRHNSSVTGRLGVHGGAQTVQQVMGALLAWAAEP